MHQKREKRVDVKKEKKDEKKSITQEHIST
jgi:hypothetical protein